MGRIYRPAISSVHKLLEAVGIGWEKGRRKRETRREHAESRIVAIIKKGIK